MTKEELKDRLKLERCIRYGISDYPERNIGDIFTLTRGLFIGCKFEVCEGECSECSLNMGKMCFAPFSQTGMCDPHDREDKKSIYFKKIFDPKEQLK